MALLQEIPAAEQFLDTLSHVIGSEAENTGVAGVLKLLKEVDSLNLASTFTSELDETVAATISTDTATFAGGVVEQFNQAIDSLPTDPETLVAPLREKLKSVKDLSSVELSGKLLESIGGFQNIQSLVPPDTRSLISAAANGMAQLKDQFIAGPWGELREWSSSVQGLYDEIAPLLTAGPGTVEDRLIAFLGDKLRDLVQIILPQREALFEKISSQLEQAISTTRANNLLTIKTDVINRFDQARSEFDSGNFTNTAHLIAAETSFQQLTGELADIVSKMSQTLSSEIASAEGMIRALERQFDDFENIEIVDLGNIKDKFEDAFQRIEDALQEVKLEVVKETIEEVFRKINELIEQFDLRKFTEKISEVQGEIKSVLDALDAALFEVVASVQNVFTQIKEALEAIASTLGSYDENGEFHFHVQDEIETFLNGINSDLVNTLQPMLKDFKDSVGGTLNQVQGILTSTKEEIKSVKTNLQRTLDDVNKHLKNLDVAGKLEEIRQKLDNMLSELGEIDFDPVVDPVVAQINEMRDELKEIDLSSLNDFLVSALKLAVKIVQELDFPEEITKVLLREIDEILEIPKGGLKGIEERVESALEKLNELEPDIILKPLDDVFDPVTEQLNALQLEKLLEPLDDWHARVQKEVDNVSPAALLQPVIDLHDQLVSSFASVSPEALVRPLQEAIDNFKSELQGLDVTGIADEVSEAIDNVKNSMDEISPENLFMPLVSAFDKIVNALDRFKPGDLLEPFTNIFDKLMAPLDNLTPDHVQLIREAFAGLTELPNAFDPQHNFQMAIQKYSEAQNLLHQINVGQMIAELNEPYNSLKTSFEAGGGAANSTIADRVKALNPLQNENISQAANEFQEFQNRLQSTFSQAPPEDLVKRYEEIKPKLELLVPTWIKDDMTPASVKEAFQRANPLKIADEVNHLYEAFKEQLQNFNPRILQENVEETFDHLKETFLALDPQDIVSGIQGVMDDLIQKLDAIDLQIIVDELQTPVDEVETIIAGLDPRPIIQQLEALTGEVQAMVAELKPSEILKELDQPFQTAKDIVEAFDPAVFKEPLQSVFEEIRNVISKIDIGIILEPLARRLEDLRDELEEGLKRTEVAFSGMLAAIPV